MTTTPLMGLELPTVGEGGSAGPDYGDMNNAAFEAIDEHNHTSGKGAKVPVAGLNINADLSLGSSYNLTNARAVRLTNQSAVLATVNDKNQLVSVNGNLYWQNASGVNVQITDNAGINIASVGTIGGDYGQPGVTASATYSDTTKAYSFTQSSGVTGKLNVSDVSLSYPAASENSVTLKAQQGTEAYSISAPIAAPTTTSLIEYTSAGIGTFKELLGTTDQVTVTSNANDITISLPSEISTTAGTFSGALTGGSLSISGVASIIGALTGGTGTFTTMNLTSLLIGGKTVTNSSGGANAYSSAGALLSRSSANSFSINVGSSVVTIGYSNINNAGSGAIGIETSTTFSGGVSGFGISFRGGIAYQMHPVSGTNRMQDTSSDSYSNGIIYVMIHQR